MSPATVPRSARKAKGVNLVNIVKLLRAQRDAWKDASPGPAASELLQQHIILTSWYPFEPFEELLILAHERLFGGSEEAAVQMGVVGGKVAFSGVHKAYVLSGDPARSLDGFTRAWSSYFDFATPSCEVSEGRAVIRYAGYPDMKRTHGLVIIGWARGLLELCGVSGIEHHVTAAPWQKGGELEFELRWR